MNLLLTRTIEIALLEIILLLALWLFSPFFASIMTFIVPMICLPILLISLIADWLEKSNISRLYFVAMAVSVIIPPLVAYIYTRIANRPWNFLEFNWVG